SWSSWPTSMVWAGSRRPGSATCTSDVDRSPHRADDARSSVDDAREHENLHLPGRGHGREATPRQAAGDAALPPGIGPVRGCWTGTDRPGHDSRTASRIRLVGLADLRRVV